MDGIIAHMTKDEDTARGAFMAARSVQKKIVQAQLDSGPALSVLGSIDAGLGRKASRSASSTFSNGRMAKYAIMRFAGEV